MKINNIDLVNYSIIAFGLYPIIPNNLKGIFTIILLITSFNYYIRNNRKSYVAPFLTNSALFFVYLISLIYTTDFYYGFKKLGTGITMVVFPLIFYLLLGNFNFKRKTFYQTLNLFSISTFIFLIGFIIYFNLRVLPFFPDASLSNVNYIRSYLIAFPKIGHHPIYVSIYISISIINSVRLSLKWYKKNITYFLILLMFLITLLFSLFFISSKGSILALVLVFVLLFNIKSKNKNRSILYSLAVVILLVFSIFIIPQANSRFEEIIKSRTYSTTDLDINNSSQIRFIIWKTSLEKIKKSPIFGYGIGDVQNLLDSSYKKNYPHLLKKQYNSHNQYFSIWLSTGILGIFLFLNFLFFNFKIGFQNKDYMFLALLLIFSLLFLIENVLERQVGATIFFFFTNLFGFYNYSNLKNNRTT